MGFYYKDFPPSLQDLASHAVVFRGDVLLPLKTTAWEARRDQSLEGFNCILFLDTRSLIEQMDCL